MNELSLLRLFKSDKVLNLKEVLIFFIVGNILVM